MIGSEESARVWFAGLSGFDEAAANRLEALAALLAEENRRQNLVASAKLPQVWQRHFADSAQLLLHVSRGTGPWLDLGTGAGFPGLVIAALDPECEVILVESRARRFDWLERARVAMGLGKVRILGGRLETLDSFPAAVISARAFAPLDKLLRLSARFSTKDTTWLLPKGRSAAQELQDLRGWRHTFHVEQSLTDPEAGIIVGKLLGR